jgi:serine/threonine-protein kinase RsbW
MTVAGSDILSMEVPCNRHAPAAIRQAFAHSAELDWELGDAMLIASELVTNAVRHSGCSEDEPIEVNVNARLDYLRITVRDPGLSGQDAHVHEEASLSGWGLQIVNQLAQRWGSDRRDGYSVWAEIALANRARPQETFGMKDP